MDYNIYFYAEYFSRENSKTRNSTENCRMKYNLKMCNFSKISGKISGKFYYDGARGFDEIVNVYVYHRDSERG